MFGPAHVAPDATNRPANVRADAKAACFIVCPPCLLPAETADDCDCASLNACVSKLPSREFSQQFRTAANGSVILVARTRSCRLRGGLPIVQRNRDAGHG